VGRSLTKSFRLGLKSDPKVDKKDGSSRVPPEVEPEPQEKPVAPFHQRLVAPKPLSNSQDILEVLKQVKINIPLLNVVK